MECTKIVVEPKKENDSKAIENQKLLVKAS
jgi:hypothetical protein